MDCLSIGTDVEVRRINGEIARGVIGNGPIEHLRHIGEYYLVVKKVAGPEPFWRGSGRKSAERLAWEAKQGGIGMYERREIRRI